MLQKFRVRLTAERWVCEQIFDSRDKKKIELSLHQQSRIKMKMEQKQILKHWKFNIKIAFLCFFDKDKLVC